MKLLAAAAAAATGIQVGSAMVATRIVVDQAGPASLALLRYAIGFCCLVPFVLVAAPRARFARRDLLPIGLLGIAQFGLLIALLNYGLRFIPSARAALIFATFPLLTMVIAAALGHERLSAGRTVGVLLTVAGVAVALGEKAAGSPAASNEWIGELAVLASALCGAVCSVLYRPYLARYPTLPVSAFAMLASVGFLAVLAAPEGFFGALPRFSAGRLARRPVHRRGQRHRLLSLALGAPSRERHRGDRLSRAQPHHRRVARRAVCSASGRHPPPCSASAWSPSASGSPTARPVPQRPSARRCSRTRIR